MTAWAYYNEFDAPTAAWLRELIRRGLVAPGEVDERSIVEVAPDDLRGFTQAHFFAGIGGWSHALRLAGWPDDRPVWTGSPPCQPFSVAGKGLAYDDERHLAPKWLDLVKVCAPDRLFGEQVSRAISAGWLDALQHELEAEGYACGAVTLASCGVGAPNIRHRLYFAAERLEDPELPAAERQRQHGGQGLREQEAARSAGGRLADCMGRDGDDAGLFRPIAPCGLADADEGQRGRIAGGEGRERDGAAGGREQGDGGAPGGGDACGVGDARCSSDERRRNAGDVGRAPGEEQGETRQRERRGNAVGDSVPDGRPGPVNGFWRAADWLACRDGSWRPVEPGVEPLADGVPARVVRLRGYGNAINPIVAAAFIEAANAAE